MYKQTNEQTSGQTNKRTGRKTLSYTLDEGYETLAGFKVVHNNCPRGILLSVIVALKSIVSQRFSAGWRGLNRRTDPY